MEHEPQPRRPDRDDDQPPGREELVREIEEDPSTAGPAPDDDVEDARGG
jgi:hypothetical protein